VEVGEAARADLGEERRRAVGYELDGRVRRERAAAPEGGAIDVDGEAARAGRDPRESRGRSLEPRILDEEVPGGSRNIQRAAGPGKAGREHFGRADLDVRSPADPEARLAGPLDAEVLEHHAIRIRAVDPIGGRVQDLEAAEGHRGDVHEPHGVPSGLRERAAAAGPRVTQHGEGAARALEGEAVDPPEDVTEREREASAQSLRTTPGAPVDCTATPFITRTFAIGEPGSTTPGAPLVAMLRDDTVTPSASPTVPPIVGLGPDGMLSAPRVNATPWPQSVCPVLSAMPPGVVPVPE
jgi:hypothetical protein